MAVGVERKRFEQEICELLKSREQSPNQASVLPPLTALDKHNSKPVVSKLPSECSSSVLAQTSSSWSLSKGLRVSENPTQVKNPETAGFARPDLQTRSTRPSGYHRVSPEARLAYDIYGCADGFPVVFFHDCGSSRLEAGFIHDSACRQGFKIISIDRPGVGRSDYFALKQPSSYCDEVIRLLDSLGIHEFGLVGLGAGGVYSLTMAHDYSDRARFQLCLAGVSGLVFNELQGKPYMAKVWNRICPPVLNCLFRLKARFSPEQPSQSLQKFYEHLSYIDRKVLLNPGVVDRIAKDQKEATRSGCAGVAQDFANSFRRLGFSLKAISVPTAIWQGCGDRFSERADGEFMAARLPHASLHRIPNRGHFFFISEMDVVLRRAKHDFLACRGDQELFA